MAYVFFCGDCNKFFYTNADQNQASAVCTHCESQTTINCQITKEQYLGFNDDRKSVFKANIRKKYPTKTTITNQHLQLQHQQRRDKLLGILFTLEGARGRTLYVCKNKSIIKTSVTAGSVLTGNATDGEKVIFYKDCTGLQFKESGLTVGYLQFETPSMQMNNQSSNFFSENTFTFEPGANKITNELMREVFYFVLELIENQKYGINTESTPEISPLLADYLKQNVKNT